MTLVGNFSHINMETAPGIAHRHSLFCLKVDILEFLKMKEDLQSTIKALLVQ